MVIRIRITEQKVIHYGREIRITKFQKLEIPIV